MTVGVPEPHPLDYDWPFAAETTARLANLMPKHSTCLAMGTPLVAQYLERIGEDVTLIDRQPLQLVTRHRILDPCTDPPIEPFFSFVIMDPPWYPEVFIRWLCWAANAASADATLVCSLWPESTRPSATMERSALIEWLNTWAQVEVVPNFLRYEMPLFEQVALAALPSSANRGSPRIGDMLVIRKSITPTLPAALHGEVVWHRFVFDSYQVALRLRSPCEEAVTIYKHPNAQGWIWPFVSRRAAGRDKIDLWSSRNEVATVEGATAILDMFREVGNTGRKGLGRGRLRALAPLLEWHLATFNFRRVLEWTHRA
jgi:hypothetical protein